MSDCQLPIPHLYVAEYDSYRPLILSVIGFRGHGKTLFLAALMHTLRNPDLIRSWPGFSSSALNIESFDRVHNTLGELTKYNLPIATGAEVFPEPGLLRLEATPFHPGRVLLCYDTGGEVFENLDMMLPYASYVSLAPAVLFLISIPRLIADLDTENQDQISGQLERLLSLYVQGNSDMGGTRKKQHLIVVFTMCEEIGLLQGGEWSDLLEYARTGLREDPPEAEAYGVKMEQMSKRLLEFTAEGLRAANFLNTARAWFKSLEFCLVSSLGAKPHLDKLSGPLNPCRVIDPLIWLMDKDRLDDGNGRGPGEPGGTPPPTPPPPSQPPPWFYPTPWGDPSMWGEPPPLRDAPGRRWRRGK